MDKVFMVGDETDISKMIDDALVEISKDVNAEYYVASKNKKIATIMALGLSKLTGAKVSPLELAQ